MHTATKDETHKRDMTIDISIHSDRCRRNVNNRTARGCPSQQTTYSQPFSHKHRADGKIKSLEFKQTPKKQNMLGQSAVHYIKTPFYSNPEQGTICTCIEDVCYINTVYNRREREKSFRNHERHTLPHALCGSSLLNELDIDTPTKLPRKASTANVSGTPLTRRKPTSVPLAKHWKTIIPLKSLHGLWDDGRDDLLTANRSRSRRSSAYFSTPTKVGSVDVGRHHSWAGSSSTYTSNGMLGDNHFTNRKRTENKKNRRDTSSLDSYSKNKNADKIWEEDGVKKLKCDNLHPSNVILPDRHNPDRDTPTDIVRQLPLDNQLGVTSKSDGKVQWRKMSVSPDVSQREMAPSTPRRSLSDIDILAPDDVFNSSPNEDTEIFSPIISNIRSHKITLVPFDIPPDVQVEKANPLLKNERPMESTRSDLSVSFSKQDSLNDVQLGHFTEASISTQNILVNDHLFSGEPDSASHSDTKPRIDSLSKAVALEKNGSSANRGRMKDAVTTLALCEDKSVPSKLSKKIIQLNSLDDAVGPCGDGPDDVFVANCSLKNVDDAVVSYEVGHDDLLTADRLWSPISSSLITTTRVESVGGGRHNSWSGTFSRRIPMDELPVPGEHRFTNHKPGEREKNQRQQNIHVSNPLIKLNGDTSLSDKEDINSKCVTLIEQNSGVNPGDGYLRTGIAHVKPNGSVHSCAERPQKIEVITISDDECPNKHETEITDVARWIIDNKDKVTQDGFNLYGNGGQAMGELTADLSSRGCLTPGLSNDLHSLNITDDDLPCSVSEKPTDNFDEKIQPKIRRSISLPLDILDELQLPGFHYQDADIESSDKGTRTTVSSLHSSQTSLSGKDQLKGTPDESVIDEDNHPDTYHSLIDELPEIPDDMDTEDEADILEDPDMTKATIDSITSDKIMPLLKQELKLLINLRRSVNSSELDSLYTQFEEKKNHSYKISDQDNQRWERKKALSKESALRCRERQQNYEADLLKSYRTLKQSNSDLESEIKSLNEEMTELNRLLDQHVCISEGIGVLRTRDGEACTTKIATQPLKKRV